MPNRTITELGQSGVETLVAVILITGLLLVASVISLQQNLESSRIQELKTNEAICGHLNTVFDSTNRFSGQSEVAVVLPKPIWVINGGSTADDFISFNATNTGFFCRLSAKLFFDPESENPNLISITAGATYISKNADGQIKISNIQTPRLEDSPGNPLCIPKTCANAAPGDTVAECGTPSNGCGTMISCGNCTIEGETCNANFQCEELVCVPQTSCPATIEIGQPCNDLSDGCGGTINGDCTNNCAVPEGSNPETQAYCDVYFGGENVCLTCENECSTGQVRCAPGNSFARQVCGQYGNPCYTWGPQIFCAQKCSGGYCPF